MTKLIIGYQVQGYYFSQLQTDGIKTYSLILSVLTIKLLKVFYFISVRYVTSWIDTRNSQTEKANLTILFDKYVPPCLEQFRTGLIKTITPISENSMVQVNTLALLTYMIGTC